MKKLTYLLLLCCTISTIKSMEINRFKELDVDIKTELDIYPIFPPHENYRSTLNILNIWRIKKDKLDQQDKKLIFDYIDTNIENSLKWRDYCKKNTAIFGGIAILSMMALNTWSYFYPEDELRKRYSILSSYNILISASSGMLWQHYNAYSKAWRGIKEMLISEE